MLAVNKLVDNKIESVCLKTIILRELIIVLAYLSTICILYGLLIFWLSLCLLLSPNISVIFAAQCDTTVFIRN
jgi:hypothetical protein